MRSLSPTKQSRAFRAIASSLLASEITPLDIHHIAEALRDDARFQNELALLLHKLASTIEHRRKPSGDASTEFFADPDDLVSAGLAVVKRRRLSKQQVIQRVRAISAGAADYFQSHNLSVRAMLLKFAENEREQKMRALVNALAGPGETDEYLKGMVK